MKLTGYKGWCFRLALCVSLCWSGFTQAPMFSGKITGGFQTPATQDAQGRRSVLKGTDARHIGNRVYEITAPRVTMFRADDTLELTIEAPECQFDQASNMALSDSSLSLKTADGQFSIEGVGWIWLPESSRLTISNQVVSFVRKGAIASASTNAVLNPGNTNDLVKITSQWFTYVGNSAVFHENVVVEDGQDRLTCEQLKIEFEQPGGVQKVEAIEKVHLAQDDTEVVSGRALYDLNENTIRLTEKPQWRSGLRAGSADLLLLNRADNTLFAEGEVYMKLPVTNMVENATNNAARKPKADFIEIYSDRFTYTEKAEEDAAPGAVYEGHVRAEHPEGNILCEQLTVVFAPGGDEVQQVVADRNVEIITRGNSAFGSRGVYNLADEKIVLSGEPHWAVDDKTGRSDLLVFYPATEELLALGNVEMILPAEAQVELISPGPATNAPAASGTNTPIRIHARMFSHQGDVAVFNEQVRVVDDRGELRCHLVTVVTGMSNQVQQIIAEGDVQIEQPDLLATGDVATYELATGIVTLTGGPPRITTPERGVVADAFLINREANTFAARGKYRITMKQETTEDLFDFRAEP